VPSPEVAGTGPPPQAAGSGPPKVPRPRAAQPGPAQPAGAQPSTARLPAAEPGAADPHQARPAEPGWGTVIATTLRLWTARRLASPRVRVLLAFVIAAIVLVAAAIPIIASRGASGSGRPRPGQSGSPSSGGAGSALAAAATRTQAAGWVAQQINGDAVVACDLAMCGALQAAGVPGGRLLVLQPSQGDPLGSEVLIATAAVRSQFGSRLTSVYAPIVLASFGSGADQIQVRVIAPDGAAAYRSGLAADAAARRTAGAEVLANTNIQVASAARGQLATGQVDPRLLLTIVTLAHMYPVQIISFGRTASGASPGVPLRSAEIAGAVPAHRHQPVSLQVLRAFLGAQRTPYRPSAVSTVRLGSRTVLDIEYPAPTPLGLLGSHG
jgi:hypothetical protein